MHRCPYCLSDEVHFSKAKNPAWAWLRRLIYVVGRCRNCGIAFRTVGYLLGEPLPPAPADWRKRKEDLIDEPSDRMPEVLSSS